MSGLNRKQIQVPDMRRPHVVILGAGASLAALPNGDKNGRCLPLMNNFVEVLNLGSLLKSFGIVDEGNFELLYSNLIESGSNLELVTELNQRIYDYFALLELPEEPTLYDHLVLSLRDKDLIATFNWDPFLVQAINRVTERFNVSIPMVSFLHGNTAIGYCMNHTPGFVGRAGAT